jgi:hypothetical protein
MSRSRTFRIATLAVRARVLAVLCAVACVLVSNGAHASAPVCDPSAATMPAPTPALPSQTGEMSVPQSCGSASPFAERGAPQREQQQLQRLLDLPDRVLPTPFGLPSIRGTLVPRPEGVAQPTFAAHVPGVFRPPRA